jgi:four helix bundle protein
MGTGLASAPGMARDVNRLAVFQLAHRMAVQVYRITASLPETERFGLQSQLRRAAVSVPANIVEGAGRRHTQDWVRFLEIALGSASETGYLLALACELGLVTGNEVADCRNLVQHLVRALQKMINSLPGP